MLYRNGRYREAAAAAAEPCAATRDMPEPGKFWNQLLDMEDKK